MLKNRSRKQAIRVQAIGALFVKLVPIVRGLIFLPLYIQILGGRTYGFWLASGGILAWLSITEIGLSSLISQRVALHYGKGDSSLSGQHIFNGIITSFLLTILVVSVGMVISIFVPNILRTEIDERDLIRGCFQLAVVFTSLHLINEILTGVSNALLKPLIPKMSMLFFQSTSLILTIVFLRRGFGLWSIPLSYLYAESGIFLVNLINCYLLYRRTGAPLKWNRSIFREYLSLSPFLILSRVGKAAVRRIEPTLITMFISPETATLFSVSRRAGEMISNYMRIMDNSTFSSFAHIFGEGNQEKIKKYVPAFMRISVLITIAAYASYVVLNQRFINIWVGPEFLTRNLLTILIGVSLLSRNTAGYFARFFTATGRIKESSILITLETTMRLILLVLLLKLIGIEGLPLALILSSGTFALIFFNKIRGELNLKDQIKFNIFFFLRILLVVAGTVLLLLVNIPLSRWITFIPFAAATGAFFFVLSVLGKSSNSFLRQLLPTRKKKKPVSGKGGEK